MSLPRSGGGISLQAARAANTVPSSPLRRGYFRPACISLLAGLLFPAQAGVFPNRWRYTVSALTLPRSGGGISYNRITGGYNLSSSPLRRGYFREQRTKEKPKCLFPAQAGVFPESSAHQVVGSSLPRSGGGISRHQPGGGLKTHSSPLRRGYFHHPRPHRAQRRLFPAQAGVFPGG